MLFPNNLPISEGLDDRPSLWWAPSILPLTSFFNCIHSPINTNGTVIRNRGKLQQLSIKTVISNCRSVHKMLRIEHSGDFILRFWEHDHHKKPGGYSAALWFQNIVKKTNEQAVKIKERAVPSKSHIRLFSTDTQKEVFLSFDDHTGWQQTHSTA